MADRAEAAYAQIASTAALKGASSFSQKRQATVSEEPSSPISPLPTAERPVNARKARKERIV